MRRTASAGELTFWVDEAALVGWHVPRRTTPGGEPRCTELAIEPVLTLRLVFHPALREAEGVARGVLALQGEVVLAAQVLNRIICTAKPVTIRR